MNRVTRASLVFGIVVSISWPSIAAAQSATSSAIAGVVKDATGAVLPGVTVEAASPALIEKIRTVVTDNDGNYKIVDLRPGTYSVTFTLTGFATVKREGIELTTGFTAAVNGEMKVGAVTESITVSGETPVVDVQNARVQNVLSKELLDATPAGLKDYFGLAAMTVGMRAVGIQDVGGNQGSNGGAPQYHGLNGADAHYFLDGMPYNSWNGSGGGTMVNWRPNTNALTETNLGLGAEGAEYETGGIQLNLVPKDGGNRFAGGGNATYMNHNFQGSNLTDEIRARGLKTVGDIQRMWYYGLTFGGPIKQDRLWFFLAPMWWGTETLNAGGFYNLTQHTPFYTPDLSRPAITRHWFDDYAARLTWQASAKDKVAFSFDNQEGCGCAFGGSPTLAPEFVATYRYSPKVFMANWTRPQTNKLLLQAGVFYGLFRLNTIPTGDVAPTDVSTIDAGTGVLYGAPATPNFSSTTSGNFQTGGETNPLSMRLTASYITGSHAFKVGVDVMEGWHNWGANINKNLQYIFFNGTPIQLTEFAGPSLEKIRLHKQGAYVQDQWTVKRLTLNLGLRYDAFQGTVLAETIPAGDFVPARSFGEVNDVPNFKDISPRVGGAYDLFGTGKTAVKASLGRYVSSLGSGFSELNNPALRAVNSTARSWTDLNRNFTPDCVLTNPAANGECGAISNNLFGTVVPGTSYADDVLHGWGNRTYTWQVAASIQQELHQGFSVQVTYNRNWYGNILVNNNTAVTAANFTPFCVTAPVDSRLPGGGGNQICGLYDVNPAQFGQVTNLVQKASTVGADLSRVYNGVDVTFNGRFHNGAQIQGGVNLGRMVLDSCALNTQPQIYPIGYGFSQDSNDTAAGGFKMPGTSAYCNIAPPWDEAYQVKFLGVYPLPYGFQVSGVFQNLPGVTVTTASSPTVCALTACATYTNAQVAPSLGRNLSAGAAGTVTVPIAPPQQLFENRVTQFDLRIIKDFTFGRTHIKGTVDGYNLFNASSIQQVNGTYGAAYLNVTKIMAARFFKVGAQFDF